MTKFRSDFNEVFRNTEKNFLIKLAKKLSQYDSVDLLTSLAALQLMPENAERTFRFETLTHVVASIKNKGFVSKPKVNLKILEKLCRCDSEGLEILVLTVFVQGEITRISQSLDRHWRDTEPSRNQKAIMEQFNKAALSEFGHSISELLDLLKMAATIGGEIDPAVAKLSIEDFTENLSNRLNWKKEKVSHAVDFLSLKPRCKFLKPESPYQSADVFPWKYNRPLSYLRRPFLWNIKDGKTKVIWGIRNLHKVSQYLIYLCLNGRLKAKSSQMKDVMSKVRNLQGTEFNNRVADLLEKNTNLIVKKQVKKIGKTKIQVGDIDVLAVDIQNFCLKLIECKNFAISRAPHEMKNELDQIFLGRKKKKSKERYKSSVQHHQERLEWVLNHLPEILAWLKLDTSIKWNVEALIVTDIELPTPHLLSSPIPILSVSELAQLYSIG